MELKKGYQQTDIGVIPEDWQVSSLGKIGEIKMCRRVFNHETSSLGEIPFYKIGTFGNNPDAFITKELFDNYRTKFSYPKIGDILISAAGTIGRTVVFDGHPSYYQDSNIVWIDNDEKLITNQFLNYVLQVVHYETEGGTIQRLYNSILKNTKFILPPNEVEQEAIATALSDADNLITALEKLIAKKRLIKKGAMQELLKPKEDWEEKTLGQVADLYQPVTISQEKFTNDGYFVYGANGIVGKYDKYNHKHWQTTITCRGSTCGTVNRTVDKCWITGNAMVANVDKNPSIDKLFFYFLLTKQDFSNCITGSGQPQIVRKPLFEFYLWLPKDKTEQTAIAEILSDMDTEIEALEKKLAKYRLIKQGMMQNLLTGKIRLV